MLLGGFIALISFVPTDDPETEKATPAIRTIGLVMFGTGALIIWMTRRREAEQRSAYGEKAVLRVAAMYNGRVTLSQIGVETDLSIDEAERVIEDLCRRNIAQPELLDDGSVEYRFIV